MKHKERRKKNEERRKKKEEERMKTMKWGAMNFPPVDE
jgi:hypothetical protein